MSRSNSLPVLCFAAPRKGCELPGTSSALGTTQPGAVAWIFSKVMWTCSVDLPSWWGFPIPVRSCQHGFPWDHRDSWQLQQSSVPVHWSSRAETGRDRAQAEAVLALGYVGSLGVLTCRPRHQQLNAPIRMARCVGHLGATLPSPSWHRFRDGQHQWGGFLWVVTRWGLAEP